MHKLFNKKGKSIALVILGIAIAIVSLSIISMQEKSLALKIFMMTLPVPTDNPSSFDTFTEQQEWFENVLLSDFTSLFEVAIFFNGLMYFFEILPLHRKRIRYILGALEESDPHILPNRPGGHREYFLKNIMHWSIKLIIFFVLFNSILSFFLLLTAGFYPELEFSSITMLLIIAWLFIPSSYIYYRLLMADILAENHKDLRNRITKPKKHAKFSPNYRRTRKNRLSSI